jgi:2-oxo-3-hexenedioate decarboxylase
MSGASGTLVDELATRLAEAERGRRAIPQLVDEHPDLDVDTAYEVQRLGFERRVAAGDRVLGYKLGLTSRAKQEAMGVSDPLWGRLAASMLHAEEEPLAVGELIHPRAEPELVFLLGGDLEGPGVSVADVLSATEGVLPGLEVLDSRYEDFKFTLPDVIADNASAARVVVGGRLVSPERFDPRLEGMVLRSGGEVAATAAGAAVSAHPAAAVAWLANSVGRLEAGSLVFSGGLCAPVPMAPGSTVTAEYTHLGSVTLRAV